ncbi:T9SS type A sorting domain-containing protein [Parvicella tangerina]|uniref:Ycf48-like protein n=1 Tax=Parvicella tangerina TaxID=2829795 RepID=A0A916N949_9FLAO|nr:T9SS type A sorting domain-containing protein [Parvicella tangerina]CAG5078222.1 Ycf48-like protein [Parvicella tangerina]
MRLVPVKILLVSTCIHAQAQWDTVAYDGQNNIIDVEITDENEFLISSFNHVYHYDFSVNSLDTIQNDVSKEFAELSFINRDTGYAVNLPSGILKTTDGGVNWFFVNSSLNTDYPNRDILFINDTLGFFTFANNGAGTFRTVDGGVTWDTLSDLSLTYNPMLGGESLFYIEDSETIGHTGNALFYISSDYGDTWTESIIDPQISLFQEVSATPDLISCVGQNQSGQNKGVIATSVDNGNSWTTVEVYEINKFIDVTIVNDSTIIAVGVSQGSYHYSIYKSTDRGQSWHPQDFSVVLPTYPYLTNVKCINQDSCIACGYSGFIIKTNNGGGQFLDVSVEESGLSSILTYPNPNSGEFWITLNNSMRVKFIQIYDLYGNIIQEKQIGSETQIRVRNLNEGVYLIKCFDERESIVTVKIVVQL